MSIKINGESMETVDIKINGEFMGTASEDAHGRLIFRPREIDEKWEGYTLPEITQIQVLLAKVAIHDLFEEAIRKGGNP